MFFSEDFKVNGLLRILHPTCELDLYHYLWGVWLGGLCILCTHLVGNGYRVSSSGHRLYRVFKPIWKFSGPQAPGFYFWVSTRDFEKQPLASEIGSNWIIFSNLRGMNKNMFKASPQVTNISWKKYVSRKPWYNLKIKDKRYERFLDPLNLQQLPFYPAIVCVESQDYPKKIKMKNNSAKC